MTAIRIIGRVMWAAIWTMNAAGLLMIAAISAIMICNPEMNPEEVADTLMRIAPFLGWL